MTETRETWHPQLMAFLDEAGMSRRSVYLALPLGGRERTKLWLIAGKQRECWEVPSLTSLFRGNEDVLGPVSKDDTTYTPFFTEIESLLLEQAATVKPPYDDDLRPCLMKLRREPDGESLGDLHDVLWQGCCLALAKHPYSEEQFKAIMLQLTRETSARKEGTPDYIVQLQEQDRSF